MDKTTVSSDLYRCILDAQRNDARSLLGEAISEFGYEKTLREVLEPVLQRIGESWVRDGISLAQGFVAGKVAEDFLDLADRFLPADSLPFFTHPVDPPGSFPLPRIAVLGNIEDDYHSMGRSMVSSFLKLKGWKIVDLGCDVLGEDFVEQALAAKACVIGVSAMMLTTARNILKVRESLDSRGLSQSMKLAVGGAVFKMRPELVAEVGGDGTAVTALDAAALFETLRFSILSLGSPRLQT